MPNWKDVYNEISSLGSPHDVVRRKYLNALYKQQERNVITYYSGWLSKNIAGSEIREEDKNGFMMAIHGLDCSKGLDLILHTPGGNIAATQSIINYLLDKFNNDIRTIVPQIAMSGGTIMALAGKEIMMAKHSSIGPIDPQINGIPAAGVIREFQKAYQEIQQNPNKATVWQFILSKYTPTLLGSCEQAIQWSNDFSRGILKRNMFSNIHDDEQSHQIDKVIKALTDYDEVKNHGRPINYTEARNLGLKISLLEDNQDFQDLVLTIHHCYMHTLSNTSYFKIIENHNGISFIKQTE